MLRTRLARISLTWGLLLASTGWTGAGADEALGPSPQDVLKSFQHDPAVRVELVAAEPVVRDPVALCFDEHGHLFVAQMQDYPNGPGDDPQAVSRIVRLLDADEDGHYEAAEVFAEHLSFVTGLTPWQGGLLVTLAGEVCWLADTDGDGQADTRETWFRGFTEENTQLRANHPTLAPDGTVYVANGLRGGEVVAADPRWQSAAGGEPLSIRGHDFRFDPAGLPLPSGEAAFEAVSGHGQFGLSIDDFGNRFVCSNRNPCMQVMLEEQDLRRNPVAAITSAVHDVSPAGEASRIYPISSGWTTSNLHAGQFSAACGVTLYRGHGLPAAFHGNVFTCDPTGNLVHRQQLDRHRPAFRCLPREDTREFLASSHDWFRPVALADGPDGCLYVIDMARAVIEHPQFMPDELKTRPDLLHGRDRGRIWRITAAESPRQPPRLAAATASPAELTDLLSHPNGWHRDTAARLLLEGRDTLPTRELRSVAVSAAEPTARSRALWLLAVDARQRSITQAPPTDDANDAVLLHALRDTDPRVRGVAVHLSSHFAVTSDRLHTALLAMTADPDPGVRFRIAVRLGEPDLSRANTPDPRVTTALADLIAVDLGDPWIRMAVATSASDRASGILTSLLPRLLTASLSPEGAAACVHAFAELAAAEGHAASLQTVLATLAADIDQAAADHHRSRDLAFACLSGIGQGLARQRQTLAQVLSEWPEEMVQAVDAIARAATSAATDETVAESTRLQAIACLAEAPATIATEAIASLVQPPTPQALRLAAIAAAARFHSSTVDDAMLADFGSQTPVVYRQVVASLVAHPSSAARLLAKLEEGDSPPLQLTDPQWKRLAACCEDAAPRVAALRTAVSQDDRQAVVARYADALDLTGNFIRGREVFRSQCSSCHRVGQIGVDVGPDISDSRTKQPPQYLSDILDPNRAIDANFFGYTLLTSDGRLLSGLITAETATSVTLRQPDGVTTTLLRDEIDELRSTGRSLMPVGLEQNVSPQQMADLITFLKNWRYRTTAALGSNPAASPTPPLLP